MKRQNRLTPPLTPNTRPVTPSRALLGTMNPNALTLPILQNTNKNSSFAEIAELSLKAEELKKENVELQEELDALINRQNADSFCQFKKWHLDFHKKLAKRDRELQEFSKHLTSFRTETNNTFVEIQSKTKPKSTQFDSIAYSLLVSNQQMSFFSTADILKQNEDLKVLIENQEETIKVLQGRLSAYAQTYNQNTAKQITATLKAGKIPTPIIGAAPTRTVELRLKRRLMSENLKHLIEERKKVLEPKMKEKMMRREARLEGLQAIKIQNVVRGFLVRKHLKEMNAAALKIQSLWRGVLVRLDGRKLSELRKPSEPSLLKVKKKKASHVAAELVKLRAARRSSSASTDTTSSEELSTQSSTRSRPSTKSSERKPVIVPTIPVHNSTTELSNKPQLVNFGEPKLVNSSRESTKD